MGRDSKTPIRGPWRFKPSMLSALAVGLRKFLPRRMLRTLLKVLYEGGHHEEHAELCRCIAVLEVQAMKKERAITRAVGDA